jgi:DNA-binding GntR family transcriptional regulator
MPDQGEHDGPNLLSQRVTTEIRDLILNGDLGPGERIGQEALAERFGTSRIPVREALRQLESEGLVSLVPNSGASVAKLDLHECLEIYKIRELLEPLALSESIPHLLDEEIDALEAAALAMEETQDRDEFLRLDRNFHLSSYRGAKTMRLRALVENYWNTTQHYRRAYVGLIWPQGNWIIFYEHRLLVEAIKRRDIEEAGRILSSHIRRTRLELQRHREIFPEQASKRRRGGRKSKSAL